MNGNTIEKPIIFTDFDGTISLEDSLVHILDLYADPNWRDIELRVKRGEIGSRVSLVEEFNTFRGTWDMVRKTLCDDIQIDPHFSDFTSLCSSADIPVVILSGGFVSFIDLLLSHHGISGIPYYANIIEFADNRATITFPHANDTCGLCGHCKTQHLQRARAAGHDYVVYIGDGTTDRCPIKVADLVFAKDSLARYCTRHNIPFVEWESFKDIEEHLQTIIPLEYA